MNFYDLGLSEKTIQAIDEFGIKEPTTVQSDVIPSILQGKDVFTIAPGGCGKTTLLQVCGLLDKIDSGEIIIKSITKKTSNVLLTLVVYTRALIYVR